MAKTQTDCNSTNNETTSQTTLYSKLLTTLQDRPIAAEPIVSSEKEPTNKALLEITEKLCILCTKNAECHKSITCYTKFIKDFTGVDILKHTIQPKACLACYQILNIIMEFRDTLIKSNQLIEETLKTTLKFKPIQIKSEQEQVEPTSNVMKIPDDLVGGKIKQEIDIVEIKTEEIIINDDSEITNCNRIYHDLNIITGDVTNEIATANNEQMAENTRVIDENINKSVMVASTVTKETDEEDFGEAQYNLRKKKGQKKTIDDLIRERKLKESLNYRKRQADNNNIQTLAKKTKDESSKNNNEINETCNKFVQSNKNLLTQENDDRLRVNFNTDNEIRQYKKKTPIILTKNRKFTLVNNNIIQKAIQLQPTTADENQKQQGELSEPNKEAPSSIQKKDNSITDAKNKLVIGFISSEQFKDLKNIKKIDGRMAKGKKLVLITGTSTFNPANTKQKTVATTNSTNIETINIESSEEDEDLNKEPIKKEPQDTEEETNSMESSKDENINKSEVDLIKNLNNMGTVEVLYDNATTTTTITTTTEETEENKTSSLETSQTNDETTKTIVDNETNDSKTDACSTNEDSDDDVNDIDENTSESNVSREERKKILSVSCKNCKKSFQRYHRCKMDNPTNALTVNKEYFMAVPLRIHRKKQPTMCPNCDIIFETLTHLYIHTKLVHVTKRTCRICNILYNDQFHVKHMATHSIFHEECGVCGKIVPLKSFRLHTLRHSKNLLCTICGKFFSEIAKLKRHEVTHGEKRHKCPKCKQAFHYADYLERHMRCHSGEKPYQCNYCKKGFTMKWNLDQHQRLHTNSLPYKCEVCFKSFRHNVTLKKHKRLAHTAKDFITSTS